MISDRDAFLACMEYRPCPRRPHHELGVWPQTRARWRREAPEAVTDFGWRWFFGEDAIGLDRRDYVPVDYGFIPPFEEKVLEETAQYEVRRNRKRVVTRALKEGTVDGGRMSMDQYLEFPVRGPADWPAVRARLVAAAEARYPADLAQRVDRWRQRDVPLCLGENCAANGFYWRAREFMGTEVLSLAWYDEPALMHEICEFFADFVIETSRPVLERIDADYFVLNEDMSMKSGPLLSPATYAEFIQPHLRRLVDFMKGCGVRYVAVDTDGDPTALLPLLMDAGVDVIWPVERASDIDPVAWRRRFGRSLRIWGGVDKRVLPLGLDAIRAHLAEFIPLIEEGGFIPTVDHTVPPDVSWDDFRRYLDCKRDLLAGDFARLC